MENIIENHFQNWLNEPNPFNENEPDIRTKLMNYYNLVKNKPILEKKQLLL